jgi:tRNA A-37 threonylcarbamoyl transferase component Bud32
LITDPRLPELFAQASELEGEAREAFLLALATSAPGVAREVRELLASEPRGTFPADTPAWERLGRIETESSAELPSQVGPFRIVRELGRGGMGRVFLAEERREAFLRVVALKVIDRLALDDESVRRFREEVRILATLEHPGIARFLDGGRTDDGVWYLALEYVEGEDLLAYTRRRELAVDERVRLFIGVLDAVDYAHSRQVIHRDLKPGNVLVGADGRPRLLDFGISKLVDAEAAPATVTRTELRAFTPAYASPEQFRGERATAASDVYSLGVVLYELLAGTRPFDASSGPAALERAVLEQDPAPPSTAARRSRAAGPERDSRRATRPAPGRLGADLDSICLKALRKESAERYASAGDFASDLARYLAGEPVAARRGGLRYRLGRRMQKHRGAIVSAILGAAAVASAIGLGLALQGRERDSPARPFPVALRGNESADELDRRFATEPESVETGVALVSALTRESRPMEAEGIVGRLRQIPGAGDHPLVDYAESLVAVNRDQPQRALAASARALAAAEAIGRRDLLARLRGVHARALGDLGRQDEAELELELAAREAEESGDDATLSTVLNDLAIRELQVGHLAAGEKMLSRALAAARAGGEPLRPGAILVNLAGVATQRGQPDLAEARLAEAIEVFRRMNSRRRLGLALSELGAAQEELGRSREAAAAYAEALTILPGLGDESALAFVRFRAAEAALREARLDAAERSIAAVEGATSVSGNREGLACAELLRGEILAARGRTADARRHFAESRRLFGEMGYDDSAAEALLIAAAMETAEGDAALAARLADEAAAPYRAAGESIFVFRAEALLARLAAGAGRTAEAERRLSGLGDGERRPGVTDRLQFLAARAALALRRGPGEAARADLERALAIASAAGRRLDELALRLDLAALPADDAGAREARRRDLEAILREAGALGLGALERRARALL